MEKELVDFEHECAAVVSTRRKQIAVLRQDQDGAAEDNDGTDDEVPASPLQPSPPKSFSSSRPKQRFAPPPTDGTRRSAARASKTGKKGAQAAQALPKSEPRAQDQAAHAKTDGNVKSTVVVRSAERPRRQTGHAATPAKQEAGASVKESDLDVSPGDPFGTGPDRKASSEWSTAWHTLNSHPCRHFDDQATVRAMWEKDESLKARDFAALADRSGDNPDGNMSWRGEWGEIGAALVKAVGDGSCGYSAVSRDPADPSQLGNGVAFRKRLHQAIKDEPVRFAACIDPAWRAMSMRAALQRTCPCHDTRNDAAWFDAALLLVFVAELESVPLLMLAMEHFDYVGARPQHNMKIRVELALPTSACLSTTPRVILYSLNHFDAVQLKPEVRMKDLCTAAPWWTRLNWTSRTDAWWALHELVALPKEIVLPPFAFVKLPPRDRRRLFNYDGSDDDDPSDPSDEEGDRSMVRALAASLAALTSALRRRD